MSPDRELLKAVRVLAEEAGRAIMAIYQTDFGVTVKDDRSPLTAADLAAHRCILDGLQQLTPTLPVLSEESKQLPLAERAAWTSYWLVDPLDGTREFVKRNGEFSVNIALVHDHEPVLGVVHAPALGWSGMAARELGAFFISPDGRERPMRVGRAQSPLRMAGSRSHADPRLQAVIERIGQVDLKPMGSALKFVQVADGQADAYLRLGPTSEWDTAAGQCVLETAGGVVTDLTGARLRYNQRETLLNPDFIAIGDADLPWRHWLT